MYSQLHSSGLLDSPLLLKEAYEKFSKLCDGIGIPRAERSDVLLLALLQFLVIGEEIQEET